MTWSLPNNRPWDLPDETLTSLTSPATMSVETIGPPHVCFWRRAAGPSNAEGPQGSMGRLYSLSTSGLSAVECPVPMVPAALQTKRTCQPQAPIHIQSHSPCPYSIQYSSECVPGCVCPNGLVADGNGSCVVAEDCPCVHNEATYRPGETIQVGCNNWYVGVTAEEALLGMD